MEFVFSSRRLHTRCALVTGVQACALPISFLRTELRQARVVVDHFTGVTIDAPEKVYRRVAAEKYWRCETYGQNNVDSFTKCRFCNGWFDLPQTTFRTHIAAQSKITTSGFVPPTMPAVGLSGQWTTRFHVPQDTSNGGFQFGGAFQPPAAATPA